jgi:soluble lytic murein transglycosylase
MTKKQKSGILNIIIGILAVLLAIAVGLLVYNEHLRRTHPILYSEIVEASAHEQGVDKFLIYAIIKTESGFNPDAVSSAGAQGLMQIMPETFEWIRDYRLKEFHEDISFDDLFNPDDNIRYGTYLISYHMRYYNNVDNSLAAYHAGDGAVDQWLQDPELSSNGRTLDSIPIPETAHYVNKVNRAYEIYLKLYGG